MCLFDDKTKIFNIIDPFSAKDLKFALNIQDKLSNFGGFCELPNSKFFCYGGYNGGYTDVAYIIDIKNLTGEKRKSSFKKCAMGVCVHYQGEIYVMGGYQKGPKPKSERYTIASDSWANIANVPSETQSNSCILVDTSIYIAGACSSCIHQYSILNNTYKSFGNFSTENKVLLQGTNNIYILDSVNLYKSTNLSCTAFTCLRSISIIPNKPLISYPVRKDSTIYFLLSNNVIYKFDIVSNQLCPLRRLTF